MVGDKRGDTRIKDRSKSRKARYCRKKNASKMSPNHLLIQRSRELFSLPHATEEKKDTIRSLLRPAKIKEKKLDGVVKNP